MEEQVGEERDGARGLERPQGCLTAAKVELAEEPNAERRCGDADASSFS